MRQCWAMVSNRHWSAWINCLLIIMQINGIHVIWWPIGSSLSSWSLWYLGSSCCCILPNWKGNHLWWWRMWRFIQNSTSWSYSNFSLVNGLKHNLLSDCQASWILETLWTRWNSWRRYPLLWSNRIWHRRSRMSKFHKSIPRVRYCLDKRCRHGWSRIGINRK